MPGGRDAALNRADRAYAGLLRLLPGDLRRDYGTAMRQTFADLCAARVDARGRGLLPILAYTAADLMGGAGREWTVTLFARGRWHRSVACGMCALAALLVFYSLARHPAHLLSLADLAQNLLLLAILVALVGGFARVEWMSVRTVGCALACAPGWLLSARLPLIASGYVVALIFAAVVGAARGGGLRDAALRAGFGCGVLTGVALMVENTSATILALPDALHARPGELGAYTIGANLCGASILLLACVATGALLGLVASVPAWRRAPGVRSWIAHLAGRPARAERSPVGRTVVPTADPGQLRGLGRGSRRDTTDDGTARRGRAP